MPAVKETLPELSKRDLLVFLEPLIDKSAIAIDTTWKKNPDDAEGFLIPYSGREEEDPFADFPLTGVRLRAYADGHFELGKHVFPADSDSGRWNPSFDLCNLRRWRFEGRNFTTVTAHLRQFNGHGGRINYNYFFSDAPPVQDIYENACGALYQPLLYGNLNGDTLLDRLVYDGFIYPNFESDTNWVNVRAQTFRDNKWQQLKDAAGKEYFI